MGGKGSTSIVLSKRIPRNLFYMGREGGQEGLKSCFRFYVLNGRSLKGKKTIKQPFVRKTQKKRLLIWGAPNIPEAEPIIIY